MSGVCIVTRGMICLPITAEQLITCDAPEVEEFTELKPEITQFTELTPTVTTEPVPSVEAVDRECP